MQEKTIALTSAGIVVAIGCTLVWIAKQESNEWDQFKTDHHCKVIGKEKGSTMNTVTYGPNGQTRIGTISTPDKTAWLCDDGVTYYR